MSTIQRKLVTIRTIGDLHPIEGADAIEVATVDGWKIVVKKGDFNIGDQCVYFEIDAFLPDGNPAWQFLVDKSSRIFEGVKGHKLRTIKLRGALSQGLVLTLSQMPLVDLLINGQPEYEVTTGMDNEEEFCRIVTLLDAPGMVIRDIDFSALFGIVKWEASLPACLQGQAQGLFPSFIRKTDQERCQNLAAEIFDYEDRMVPFDIGNIPADALTAMEAKGELIMVDGTIMKVLKAKAQRHAMYEVSMKLDGSSMTAFARTQFTEPLVTENGIENPIKVGVCSRNLQLKISEENADNAFVKMATESGLLKALEALAQEGIELAVQGELMGEGLQGNQERLSGQKFFVFDIFDICASRYLAPAARMEAFNRLVSLGANIQHVPILHGAATLEELGIVDMETLLSFANGPSLNPAIKREGLVFKRADGQFSFKSISNEWLVKSKE